MTNPPDTRQHGFVLNVRAKVVHRLPASESCNTDQIAKRRPVDHYSDVPDGYRRCSRCFPAAQRAH